MNRIVKILMERDGNNEREAIERIINVKMLIEECNYDPDESEAILMEELGLEPDYIMDLLF